MASDEEYQEQVVRAVLDEAAFVKATFSGRRRGYELPWRRVTVRPVEIQGKRMLQVSHLDEKQDVTKNYEMTDAPEKVRELVDLPFSQIHVVTTEGDLQAQISRKGKWRLHRHATSAPRAAPDLAHDRQKAQPIPGDTPDPFLQAIGIQTEGGQVRASKRRKLRQINEFLRLVLETGEVHELEPPVRVVDCGCGSADLTFAIYHYLNHMAGKEIEAVGIDVKESLMAKQNEVARRLGWEGLHFEVSRIIDFAPDFAPDIVLALHACDTATDEALAQAVRWGAHLIFSAPCCHHDLQAQMADQPMPPVFQPVLRHGILKERVGDVLTDSFRAQILRIMGYRTDVVEFIAAEHTDKNLMIRAVKATAPGDPQMVAEYQALTAYWQVRPYLAVLLDEQMPVS